MLRKILLATDGSEGALRAAEAAGELARRFDAEVLVIYVLPPVPALARVAAEAGEPDWAGSVAALRGFEQAGRDILARTAEVLERAGVRYTAQLERGHPAERICEVSHDEACDAIVIGHRGLEHVATFPLGSVAEWVSRCAPCSVIIVR